jgi:tetraacyldisaccharide 4'-kinase
VDTVDQVLINGSAETGNAIAFELLASDASRLNGSITRPLEGFRNTTVHAVAAIGNPKRFFDLLQGHGIQVIEHSHPDHATLSKADLEFGDEFEVFMTEKDAVKLGRKLADKYWFVPVDLSMDAVKSSELIDRIDSRLHIGGDTA